MKKGSKPFDSSAPQYLSLSLSASHPPALLNFLKHIKHCVKVSYILSLGILKTKNLSTLLYHNFPLFLVSVSLVFMMIKVLRNSRSFLALNRNFLRNVLVVIEFKRDLNLASKVEQKTCKF